MYGWHPGYCDDHIMEESTCNLHRCKELQACTSEEYKNWIIENKIELVNQRDVLYGTNEFQDHLKCDRQSAVDRKFQVNSNTCATLSKAAGKTGGKACIFILFLVY